jgi:hypothetical protein
VRRRGSHIVSRTLVTAVEVDAWTQVRWACDSEQIQSLPFPGIESQCCSLVTTPIGLSQLPTVEAAHANINWDLSCKQTKLLHSIPLRFVTIKRQILIYLKSIERRGWCQRRQTLAICKKNVTVINISDLYNKLRILSSPLHNMKGIQRNIRITEVGCFLPSHYNIHN